LDLSPFRLERIRWAEEMQRLLKEKNVCDLMASRCHPLPRDATVAEAEGSVSHQMPPIIHLRKRISQGTIELTPNKRLHLLLISFI